MRRRLLAIADDLAAEHLHCAGQGAIPAVFLDNLHQEHIVPIGFIQLTGQFIFLLFEHLIVLVGCVFVHFLLVDLLQKMSLVMRVSVPLDFFLAFGCNVPTRGFLEEQLLDLLAQVLVLGDHLIDRKFEQELVGILDHSETIGLLLALCLDEHLEALRGEREEGFVVDFFLRFLMMAACLSQQWIDSLLDLCRQLCGNLLLPFLADLARLDDLILLSDGNVERLVHAIALLVLRYPHLLLLQAVLLVMLEVGRGRVFFLYVTLYQNDTVPVAEDLVTGRRSCGLEGSAALTHNR